MVSKLATMKGQWMIDTDTAADCAALRRSADQSVDPGLSSLMSDEPPPAMLQTFASQTQKNQTGLNTCRSWTREPV